MSLTIVKLKATAPAWIKQPYRHLCSLAPYSWRCGGGREYRLLRRVLSESAHWDTEGRFQRQTRDLALLVDKATTNVPFYSSLFGQCGLRPSDIRTPSDLIRVPFMERQVLVRNVKSLTARNVPWWRRGHQTTGGTSGMPVPIVIDRLTTLQRDRAYWDDFLEGIGIQRGTRMITLRNDMLCRDRLTDYSVKTKILRLDPFKLSPSNVSRYIDAVIDSGIDILHTYPSAAETLLRLARQANDTRRLPIRKIVATSENLYPGQRVFLEEGYNARVYAMYGQSERVAFAGECEARNGYHVNEIYGILELVDDHGSKITAPGVQGEIVGTGFVNDAMPLIRYRTGDMAEYVPGGCCPCGRTTPRLIGIKGRWLQELIQKPDGGVVSITAMNMHSDVFNGCLEFQFVQERPGELIVLVVPCSSFSAADRDAIQTAVGTKLGQEMKVRVECVKRIERTAMGKHRFLVQNIRNSPFEDIGANG